MLLEVEKLNTFYGASHVLRDVTLNVAEGELVALMGRNGMGKSTALKTIMGLVNPRSGSILFKGKNIASLAPYKIAREGISYVPEDRRIFPELSVLDNLMLGVKDKKFEDPENPNVWTVERIYSHFPMLEKRRTSQGRFLSGGEQQMLSIGRSLMGNPHLLLVDEPTEGLAPQMKEEVRDILAEIHKAGVAILLVEHNLKIALSLAQRVYLMGKAHIGYGGTIDELTNNQEILAKYLEA
ncbi:MAG: ABC transporter ATP-binding protein [Deltaproteobacteria bacterium]|nr:ABC transporter ATP-binding protein [Deltaproteobacteria bacterium]